MDKEQVLDKIRETVTFARSLCDNVQWSPMDATRTEHDYLVEAVSIAVECGATTINIPDTVGYTAPGESAELIQMLMRWRQSTQARAKSNAQSTASVSGQAIRRWKKS